MATSLLLLIPIDGFVGRFSTDHRPSAITTLRSKVRCWNGLRPWDQYPGLVVVVAVRAGEIVAGKEGVVPVESPVTWLTSRTTVVAAHVPRVVDAPLMLMALVARRMMRAAAQQAVEQTRIGNRCYSNEEQGQNGRRQHRAFHEVPLLDFKIPRNKLH